jgi:hypothetical protein
LNHLLTPVKVIISHSCSDIGQQKYCARIGSV